MVDLEEAQPVGKFPLAQAEGVQSGAEYDVLARPGGNRLAEMILGEAQAQDRLGYWRRAARRG